jgi:hypothetical protein
MADPIFHGVKYAANKPKVMPHPASGRVLSLNEAGTFLLVAESYSQGAQVDAGNGSRTRV